MSSSKVVGCLAAVAVLGLAWAGLAGAQEGQRPQGRQGRERFDPAQMRERMMNRMREGLGATEEEWTVLGPGVASARKPATAAGRASSS